MRLLSSKATPSLESGLESHTIAHTGKIACPITNYVSRAWEVKDKLVSSSSDKSEVD